MKIGFFVLEVSRAFTCFGRRWQMVKLNGCKCHPMLGLKEKICKLSKQTEGLIIKLKHYELNSSVWLIDQHLRCDLIALDQWDKHARYFNSIRSSQNHLE